jgi:hypothetical protein
MSLFTQQLMRKLLLLPHYLQAINVQILIMFLLLVGQLSANFNSAYHCMQDT